MRETIGFAWPFSAHPSQKNPGIQQVFPDFFISSERKMTRAKLLHTANIEMFVPGKAPGTGILDMYSEYRQRRLAQKEPVCGCRIPNLHTPSGGLVHLYASRPSKTIANVNAEEAPSVSAPERAGKRQHPWCCLFAINSSAYSCSCEPPQTSCGA